MSNRFYVNEVPREPGIQMALVTDNTVVFTDDHHSDWAILRLQYQVDSLVDWTEAGKWP